MSDYISRQKVERFIENGLNNPDKSKAFGHDAVEILTEVHFMDAADVQPVVYCKDCTLSRENGFFCTSTFHGGMTFPNDFCSLGERREGGTP